MAYLSDRELASMGFKSLGVGVKISDKASVYNPELIEIGDYSRIDDFCVISGKLNIGRNVHITPQCLVAGGEKGIEIGDFVALAYQCKVFSQSDDYTGESMTNSTVPKKYKNEIIERIVIGKHSIIGAGSSILPGVSLAEGTSIGANSLVNKSTKPWSIYIGVPVKFLKKRSKKLLAFEKDYMRELNNDSV
ncbi:acyltransferase [Vibrio sp. DNB22_10_4]